eukprot:8550399-Ditylum_brightwellii.AAC.1
MASIGDSRSKRHFSEGKQLAKGKHTSTNRQFPCQFFLLKHGQDSPGTAFLSILQERDLVKNNLFSFLPEDVAGLAPPSTCSNIELSGFITDDTWLLKRKHQWRAYRSLLRSKRVVELSRRIHTLGTHHHEDNILRLDPALPSFVQEQEEGLHTRFCGSEKDIIVCPTSKFAVAKAYVAQKAMPPY